MAGQTPASVGASSKGPALIPLGHHTGKPPIPLHRPVAVIGSRSNARIHLTSSTVSKAHALVVKDGPNVYIRDLASRTHVYVNGDKIRDQILENGDLIKIGSFTFKFRGDQALADPTEKTASAPPAKLEVTGADYPVPIDERVLLIGRRQSCDVHMLEDSASTAHAVVFEMGGHRHVRDLGSRTGTYVNGVAVHQHQLNAGDHIRIGETTLTYTPTAELSIAQPAAGGSVLDLDVETAQQDEIEIGRPAAPHIDEEVAADATEAAAAAMDALDVDELAPTDEAPKTSRRAATPISPRSTDKAGAPVPLSESPEKLSPAELAADSDLRSDASTNEVGGSAVHPAADEDDLRPRRGWRPATGAPAEELPPIEEVVSAEAIPPAEQPQAQQQDDDLLRISPTISANELDQDTTSADQGAGAAVLNIQESEITAGQFTEQSETDKSGDDKAVDDLLDLALEEVNEQPAERERIDIDLSPAAPAKPVARETEPLEALDFSTLRSDASSADVIEPTDVEADAPIIEPIVPAAAPSMRFDRQEPKKPAEQSQDEAPPLIEIDEALVEAEVEPVKPKRGRKKKGEPAVEKVAASRTRKKPADAVAEQNPAEPVVPQPALEAPKQTEQSEPIEEALPVELTAAEEVAAEKPDEVIGQTEPTPESALDLEIETSTTGATFDEAAIESALGEPTVSDPMTDTGVTRAMHDLAGDAGEIIEAPIEPIADESKPELTEPVAEAPPPVAPAPQPPASPAPAPEYRWGANQENFLGGVPVRLPPVAPPSPSAAMSRRPIAPGAPIELPAEAEIETELDLIDEAPQSETGQQIDEVNALIDEILAPTGEDVATKDDLLAQPAPSVESNRKSSNGDGTALAEPEAEESSPDLLNDVPPPLPMPAPDEEVAVTAKIPEPRREGHDPAQSRPVIPIPPPPLRGRRPPRRSERSPQVAAPGLRDDERIPPYAGAAAPTMGRVTTKFDGLAMPPVREADVFSQMSPPATSTGEDPFGGMTNVSPSPSALTPMDMVQAEEPPRGRRAMAGRAQPPRDMFFAGGGGTFAPTIDEPIPGQRRRPPVRPAIPGTAGRTFEQEKTAEDAIATASRRAGVVMGEEDAQAAHQKRRSRVRWISTLAIVGLLLWGGAAAAIFYLFQPGSLTEVAVRFRNYDQLSINERRNLQDEQQKLLNVETTRIAARRFLSQSDPEIAPGFLEDVEKYLASATRTTWPDNRKGVMLLSHKGTSDAGDRARMVAMGQALYSQNESRINDAKRLDQQLQQLREAKDAMAREKAQLAQEIEQLRIQGDSAPDTRQINQIRDEVQLLEKAWGDALAAVKSAEAELKRLKQDSAAAPTAAGNDGAKPAINDETLAAMETQLAELTGKLTAAQTAKNEQAAAARKALDSSLQVFEQQIGAAKELMKDSPELSEYVTAAQRLQENTRQIVDDLIRRQEQQYSRLNELKQSLTDQMEQRRAEQLGGDAQLKELNERLATATRQLNAAKNSGMKKEADDKQEEVKLLSSMIKAREEMLPKDPALTYVAQTIAQLQSIIDTTQENVENDRKRADQLLAKLQENFASNAAVEKLPEAQKSVAADLEKRLADINAARKQYNEAISATAVDEDESVKQLRTQAAAIQTAIESRKKDIADTGSKTTSAEQEKARLAMIPLKEKDLLELTKAEANARQAYTNREKDYRDAQAAAKLARDSQDHLTELQQKQATLEQKLAQANRDLPAREEQAKRAVMPDPVTDADVTANLDADKRPILWLSSTGVIFVLFAGLMLFTLHTTSPGAPAAIASIDEISNAHNGTNGAASNGDGNGQSPLDDADDSEPATV